MSLEGKTWSVLDVVVPSGAVDLVSGVLFEHGCLGLEEREASDDRVGVRAYFEAGGGPPAADGLRRSWEAIGAVVTGLGAPEIRIDALPYDGWAENWKEHFRPFRVGRHLVVSPTWETPELGDDDVLLEIDPGMAFGTGSHETTRLCLARIEALLVTRPGAAMLDVGCGSGILSIAAARCGAGSVTAVDVDPDAVRIAVENVESNGVADRVRVSTDDVAALTERWPLVVANILAHILIEIAPDVAATVSPAGTLLLSGILAPQAADVERAYASQGLTCSSQSSVDPDSGREEDRWVLLELTR